MASSTQDGMSTLEAALHPYSPPAVVISGYVANTLSTLEILAIFAVAVSALIVSALGYIRQKRPDLRRSDLAAAAWFVMCAGIHMVLEGYFAVYWRDIGRRSAVLGQLWKEYSLSDSRYLTQDAFLVSMETVTAAFWGPMSLVIVWFISVDHPSRHPLQLVVSLGQLYGDVLYYATAQFQSSVYGLRFCRPEAIYFYAYYVLMNAFWIVIPSVLIISSVKEIARAISASRALESGKKMN